MNRITAALASILLASTAVAGTRDTILKLPIHFEPNRGQSRDTAPFVAKGLGYQMSISASAAKISFTDSSDSLTLTPLAAEQTATIVSEEEQIARINYLFGQQRIENLPTFAKLRVQQIYPGIDLVYYGNGAELEYDFEIAPNTDPRAIQIAVSGADRMTVDAEGNLRLVLGVREILQRKPLAYQLTGNVRAPVSCAYTLRDNIISFTLGEYDTTRPLIIDPVLVYSTYFGSSAFETVGGIAVDASENLYITGVTGSAADFPFASAYLDHTAPRIKNSNAYVLRISPGGTLIYATYLGGEEHDQGYAIAVDNASNAYVTGLTRSSPSFFAQGFPVTPGAVQSNFFSGSDAVFVTKLSAAGGLVYSTFLMSERNTGNTAQGNGITVDGEGYAYVTGHKAFRAFAVKLNQAGTAVLSERMIGSTVAYGIDLGPDNSIFLAGDIVGNPVFFPVTNSFELPGSLSSAFLIKIAPDGTNLLYSTTIGSRNRSTGSAVAVDPDGMAYITGSIRERDRPDNPLNGDFPAKNSFQPRHGGGLTDAYIAKFDPTKAGAESLLYTTYLGGTNDDSAASIVVDAIGQIFVAGTTASTNFPLASAVQTNYAGGTSDAFVSQLNAGGTGLVFSSFLGGTNADLGSAIAVDLASNNIYFAGRTSSGDFPTTNAFQQNLTAFDDGFAAKIQLVEPQPTLVVNTTNDLDDGVCDSVHCSLREAINTANKSPQSQTITFDISGPDEVPPIIRPETVLPFITKSMVIDATTQPRAGRIELSGENGGTADGFVIDNTEDVEIRGFIINRFGGNGIEVRRGGKHRIRGNRIGTDLSGNADEPNGSNGIELFNSANNEIGGSEDQDRNIISGNVENGILISGEGSVSNRVIGNFIGTTSTGGAQVPNGHNGILIDEGSFNQIGGGLNEGNVISGNARNGIAIQRPRATENRILGNNIGVSDSGQFAVSNLWNGIFVDATGLNRIGTDGPAEGNIISGNGRDGILLADTSSIFIQNNSIGTDAIALSAIANGQNGITLQNSSGNQIGGTNGVITRQGNTVSGNRQYGIEIRGDADSGENSIVGNMIGCDFLGIAPIKNHTGVRIATPGNKIGLPSPEFRNVISGNEHIGVFIEGNGASNTVVQGNYIGLDKAGTVGLSNATGIFVRDADSILIGGTSLDGPAPGNIISANSNVGIYFQGSSSNNVIQGNFIGLDKNGANALANDLGVLMDGVSHTLIGGYVEDGNVISGNTGIGLLLSSVSDTEIFGNIFGADSTGTRAVPNKTGILLSGRVLYTDIGTAEGKNLIAGNSGAGIEMEDFAGAAPERIRILDNDIGIRRAPATNPLPNGGIGIHAKRARGLRIAFNRIAHNLKGISLESAFSWKNVFDRNSIFENLTTQIDLGNDDHTSNDENDRDDGPNHLQNYPAFLLGSFFGRPYLVGVVQDDSMALENLDDGFIQVFYGDSNETAGRNYFYSAPLPMPRDLALSRPFILPAPGLNTFVTTTYTSGVDNTSEMSPPVHITVGAIDSDLDGVPNEIERLAPNNGDGNNNSVPDEQEPNTFSSPTPASVSYKSSLTLSWSVSAEYSISKFEITDQLPSTTLPPEKTAFKYGFTDIELDLSEMNTAGTATLTVHLPPGEVQPNRFYNYGRLAGMKVPEWYDFSHNGTTGARFENDKVILELRDGERGDADLQKNGVIALFSGLATEYPYHARIDKIYQQGAGRFVADVTAEAGRTYKLQASKTLFDWSDLGTKSSGTGIFQIEDESDGDFVRFYRLQRF